MVQPIIDGRKAGEGSPRQPVIAPDSARSVTLLKQVVGLSEGEIEGFGKDDIKLDGTPLSELSSEIICDYRFGTNSQEYINGVDEVANEIGVGVELRGDLDWVKLITNTDIDHVGIRLRWGPLQTSHTNGDVSGVSISYQILIAPVGGAYEEVLVTTLSDKTSDSYERYHEFKLPLSDNGWMIKVVRTTPSAQSTLVSDKMYVQAYAEIIKSKFTFPYTSLIYLEYDARSFSNVAKLAVNAKGMIVKVPMNYDPVTRQYTGLWDGVFKMAYTNNPAWIYYDIVTQRRYGCGDRIDQSMVDKWSLYRLGQYCDQMVDDGYGGLEPRFTCNVYLQSKERVYDVLNRLTGLFRAINFWNGSQLVVDADIPQDTSYLYTNANVVDGLFEYAGTAATDLYSAVKVAWDNPANGYNTEYEAVSYEHLVKKLGFKTLELDAWGCTSRGQALRAGRWALLAESDTVTFKVGMDGYLAMPGKIIEIQDEFYAGKSVGGRVIGVSSSGLEITLDRPVETIAGDTISFNTVLGVVKKFNIASSNGTVVTLTESVGSSVERMHIWAINSSQLATQKYRILSVKFDGIGEFTISAVEYDQNKYEEIDSNIVFDEAPTSIINPIAQVAVKNVTISSNEYVYQGLNTVNLEIKWERAENAVEYLVELKKDDGSWLKLPSTGNNSIVLENVYAGYYIASVTAISAYELKSLPAYSVKTVVLGKQSTPLAPVNPRIVPIQFGIEFYWDFPQGATDTAVSRIIVSYLDPTDAVDDSGFLSYDKAYSDNKIIIQNLSLHTRVWFKVKLIDKLGFESPYTSWISGIPSQDYDKIMDLISGQIEQSDLYADLSQKIEVGVEASAAAASAQTSADQAQASADQAQTAANQVQAQVTATTSELRGLLDIAADGLTQEILDRQEGDADVVGQLTTYKTSNDAAMSAVQQQAEAATSASSANATALTNLNTEVDAAHNLASNALQQAQSATDATSTNASNLIALNSRMDSAEQDINGVKTSKLDASVIQQYRTAVDQDTATASSLTALRAQLATGARNFVRGTKEPAQGLHWLYQRLLTETLTGVFTISFDVEALDDTPASGSGAGVGFNMGTGGDGGFHYVWYPNLAMKGHLTHTLTLDSEAFTHFGIYANNYVKITNVMVQRGAIDYPWAAAPEDNEAAIEANAQAIRNTEATVATVDGKVNAQVTDLLNLSTELTNLNNTKLDASIIQQYRTAVDQDNVTSGAITQFSSKLKVGGENLLSGTALLEYPTKYKGFGVLEATMAASTESQDFFQAVLSPLNEEDYVLSFDAKSDREGALLTSYFYDPNSTYYTETSQGAITDYSDGHADIRLSTEWKRYWVKWKHTPTNGNKHFIGARLYPEGITTIYSIARMQLEVGSIPSEYSDRPIDILNKLSANATAIENTNTQVSNVANNLAAESAKVTNLSASLANLSLGGFNLLYNGDFSTNSYSGWNFAAHITPAENIAVLNRNGGWLSDLALDADPSRTLSINTAGSFPVDGPQYIDASQKIAVVGDRFYQLSAYVAPHRSKAIVYATFLNHLGEIIGYSTVGLEPNSVCSQPDAGSLGGKLLQNYRRIYVNTKTPSDAAYLHFNIRFVSFDGAYLFMTRTMCCQVSSLNAPLMPWNEGSSAAANVASTSLAKVNEVDGKVTALAVETNTLSTTVGNNTAAIQLQQSSIDGINAKATLQVEAGGTIGGVALGNNGGVVDFLVRANTFAITTPEGVPNDTKYMMTYQANDQTLPNGTVIPKGLKVNDAIIGTINANKIYAESLSAVSANLGTFTTANAKGTMKIAGTEISVKDINGVERIYIGL